MLSLPYCWRTSLFWAVYAGLLVACGSTPGDLPGRTGFPGETATAETAGAPIDVAGDALPLETQTDTLDRDLFAPTLAALADGDWLAATLALPQTDARDRVLMQNASTGIAGTASASSLATALWIDYFSGRIALLRGDTAGHKNALTRLRSRRLPEDLSRELLLHELDLAQQNGRHRAQFELGMRLLSLGEPEEITSTAVRAAVWSAAQRLTHNDARASLRAADARAQGWVDLAAANASGDALNSTAALSAWEAQYPEHSAQGHARALRESALRDAQTTNLTLLLPLSGPLEQAGDAVSRGFIAAFFDDQPSNLHIDVLDSRRFENIADAYRQASAKGAHIIVGPLGKRQVEELLALPDMTVPVLSLNRPEFDNGNYPGALLLSLAPEDEARQLADEAYADGARRALVIRPDGEWGERMETALNARWRQLGGQVPSTAVYSQPSTHSNVIRDALGLGDSAQRSAALRTLFNERVETSGRRREDLDVIFLLSKSNDEAQALKPLVNYHYAGELPVYSLSTADSGSNSAKLNGDLGGLRLLAMPWRMDENTLPGGDFPSNSAALHALGADAYALARRWWRMRSTAAPLYFGLTAELRSSAGGSLQRRLNMAEFDRGALRAR